jgi:2',3'-cyclic-nucleotide 2'-phosphodiesterase
VRVLMVGDVIGGPGRQAVAAVLPRLRAELGVQLVIANGENSAGGRGLTRQTAEELLAVGVDVLTTGNHVWAQREAETYLEQSTPVLRPLNYPPGVPGRGALTLTVDSTQVRVINLMGTVHLAGVDNPFRVIDQFLHESPRCPVTVVDFHAEVTSEKVAMGWHLDGRVSAVLGTHTHVPTADARLLPAGTAVVTDVGMVGPVNSIIGASVEPVLRRFLTQMPARFTTPGGPVGFNAVLVTVDEAVGRGVAIARVDRVVHP